MHIGDAPLNSNVPERPLSKPAYGSNGSAVQFG